MIEVKVILETNPQGYPIFIRQDNRKSHLFVAIAPESKVTEIEIAGDGTSLYRLGEILIGVSKTKGFHVHLESSSDVSPISIKPESIHLIISNTENPENLVQPASLTPDRAQG